uniref:EGF-like domain-containing protein n=1 Tax=Trichuris muris TaxID=70415 RepID=A0A5S6R2V5_TRIMR
MNCSWENKIECCVETAEQTLDPCTDYIYGTNISLAKNNCAEKGGVRSRDVRGHYRCACKTGYHGHLCEQQTDHCISMPCKNGASCTSSGPYFSCKCKPGYRGDYCEESYITCDQGAVCHNDGTCKPTDDGYVCDCKPNYAGTHCEKQHEHCETVTCLPHGECFNLTDLGTFKCYCQSDYTGRLCNSRIAKTTATPGETAPQEVDQNFLIIMAVCAGLICLTVAAFVYMRMKQKRIGIESQYCSSRAEVSTRSTKRTNSATGYSKATSAWAYIKSRAGKKRSASQQSSRTYEYSNVTRR